MEVRLCVWTCLHDGVCERASIHDVFEYILAGDIKRIGGAFVSSPIPSFEYDPLNCQAQGASHHSVGPKACTRIECAFNALVMFTIVLFFFFLNARLDA